MNSTELPNESLNLVADKTSLAGNNATTSCTTGSCIFSNYYAQAFLIPFIAVTAYTLSAPCSAGGNTCIFSAAAVGGLAGLTSIFLVAGVKKLRHLKVAKT